MDGLRTAFVMLLSLSLLAAFGCKSPTGPERLPPGYNPNQEKPQNPTVYTINRNGQQLKLWIAEYRPARNSQLTAGLDAYLRFAYELPSGLTYDRATGRGAWLAGRVFATNGPGTPAFGTSFWELYSIRGWLLQAERGEFLAGYKAAATDPDVPSVRVTLWLATTADAEATIRYAMSQSAGENCPLCPSPDLVIEETLNWRHP